MFLRALFAFLILPGFAAFIMPLILAAIDPWRFDFFWLGLLVVLIGLVLLLWCVRDFYMAGKGTLAPWDPPKRLVVIGLYRYMRNPMYVGVLLLVAGWSLLFSSPVLVVYTIMLAIVFHVRVLLHEEPWLESQFGDDWRQYRASVNRWLPRFMPWYGAS